MLKEDPHLIVYDLLRTNWDATNTPLADAPKFQTGWYDFGAEEPQVTITNSMESVAQGGDTAQTAGTGAGGLAQYKIGRVLVNTWGGTYGDLEGKGDGGSDVSPKDAAYQMAKEVSRITNTNASGTTDSNGNKQLHSLATDNIRRIAETDMDPTIFRYEVIVRFSYAEKW